MRGWRHLLLTWGGGLFASILIVWAPATILTNRFAPMVWDDLLGRYVRHQGLTVSERTEGWADTHVGAHGLVAGQDAVASGPSPKIVLWGDSHAEANCIPDSDKIMSVFNTLARDLPVKGFTVGVSRWCLADYNQELPVYEKSFSNIIGHVILLNGVDKLLPTRDLPIHAHFLANPWRFVEHQWKPTPRGLLLSQVVYGLHLQFAHELYRKALDTNLRFAPGRVASGVSADSQPAPPEDLEAGWLFALDALRLHTKGFIAFVYCPFIPQLVGGQVLREDPERAIKQRFQAFCQRHDVPFLDMTQDTLTLFDTTGQLTHGFFNSPPGQGHLNSLGQALVAQRLFEFMRSLPPPPRRPPSL